MQTSLRRSVFSTCNNNPIYIFIPHLSQAEDLYIYLLYINKEDTETSLFFQAVEVQRVLRWLCVSPVSPGVLIHLLVQS